jgi:hypothetical protein
MDLSQSLRAEKDGGEFVCRTGILILAVCEDTVSGARLMSCES